MEDFYFKKIMTSLILLVLLVLSFFLLKPTLMSIIAGLILAFIFYPIYEKVLKVVKSEEISAGLMCLLLFLLIVLPLWFLTPLVFNQSVKIFLVLQDLDFVSAFKSVFPNLFASDIFSEEIGPILQSFVSKATNYLTNSLSSLILNFPTILLRSLVVFFTFFFALKDKDKMADYAKSLSPFSREIEKKLFESSKIITRSIIYGQFVIGVIQGLIVGVGFFIFKIPNALFLTLLAFLAGIFPVIGTAIVWVPVAVYLFIDGNLFSVFGVILFGLFSSTIDNFLRPILVSKRARMNSLLMLLGIVGGFFFFGILGFILGPLILAYLVIILEIYRNKDTPGILIKGS